MEKEIHSLTELARFANTFAACIDGPLTIGLSGELGAGKTTFVRYVVGALGSSDPVSSPSYVLQHIYQTPKQHNFEGVEHWDLYRLSAEPDELYEPSHAVRFIEWISRGNYEASCDLTLELQNIEGNPEGRTLKISSLSEAGKSFIDSLAKTCLTP